MTLVVLPCCCVFMDTRQHTPNGALDARTLPSYILLYDVNSSSMMCRC